MKKSQKILSAVAVLVVGGLGAYAFYASKNPAMAPAPANPNPAPDTNTTPTANPTVSTTGSLKDGSYTGTSVAAAYFGNIQVQAVVSGGKLTDVVFLDYPKTPAHSLQVSQNAMPVLTQEAIVAQSADVSTVSGATDDTNAFNTSLASALAQAQS